MAKKKTGGNSMKKILSGIILGLMAGFLMVTVFVVMLGSVAMLDVFKEDCVAIVPIEGTISTESASPGLFGGGTTGSGELTALLKEADERDEVKAIVVYVNSGGGGVVASREIYDAVSELEKPTVGYIREVGASGGYYAITDSDYIISSPEALTGSIGVIATVQDMSKTFEMLGINNTNFVSGEHKDMGSPDRPMTEEEKEIMQGIADEVFLSFKTAVLDGRGGKLDMTRESEIFDGRIMTGLQAKDYGLIDETGSKQDAIRKAAELSGMEYDGEPNVCVLSPEKDFWSEVFSSALSGVGISSNSRVRIE